jgi:hypothetical protein
MSDSWSLSEICPPHRFFRRPWWWLRRHDSRYVCWVCGMVTGHYNSLDRRMSRPIHENMSVAYRGVNTFGRAPHRI